MPAQHTAYQACFDRGSDLLNQGEYRTALNMFETARNVLSPNGEGVATTAEVAQQIGICLRLIGGRTRRPFEDKIAYQQQQIRHFSNAEEAFQEALNNCHDEVRRATILRDLGMLHLDRGHSDEATRLFEMSCTILTELQKTCAPQEWEPLQLEYGVSLGFRARPLIKTSPHRALDLFRRAHKLIEGNHDVYELSNLAWYQKVAPIHERISMAARGVQLALRPRNAKRIAQVLVQVPFPRVSL